MHHELKLGLLLKQFSRYLFIASAILLTNSSSGVVMCEDSQYCTEYKLSVIIIIKPRKESLTYFHNESTQRTHIVFMFEMKHPIRGRIQYESETNKLFFVFF